MEETLELFIPILAILLGGMIILVPIAGLTARFALKPIMDVFMRYREAQGQGQALQLLERRLALVEEQQHRMERALAQIAGGVELQKTLEAPKDEF